MPFGTDQVPADPLQGSLGRGESDALDGRLARFGRRSRLRHALLGVPVVFVEPVCDQCVEALKGEGEVGAALGAGNGVDLVDDHRLDPGQDLPRTR